MIEEREGMVKVFDDFGGTHLIPCGFIEKLYAWQIRVHTHDHGWCYILPGMWDVHDDQNTSFDREFGTNDYDFLHLSRRTPPIFMRKLVNYWIVNKATQCRIDLDWDESSIIVQTFQQEYEHVEGEAS